jgi:hypothetical protein
MVLPLIEWLLAIRWAPAVFRSGLIVHRRALGTVSDVADYQANIRNIFGTQRVLIGQPTRAGDKILVRRHALLPVHMYFRATLTQTSGFDIAFTVRVAWWAFAWTLLLVCLWASMLWPPHDNAKILGLALSERQFNLVALALASAATALYASREFRAFLRLSHAISTQLTRPWRAA